MDNFRRRVLGKGEITLTLSSSSARVQETSGSTSFYIYVDGASYTGDAEVTCNVAWATVSYNSSSGKVTVTYEGNESENAALRTATVTVKVSGKTTTFSLTQYYIKIITSLPYDGTINGHKYITIAGIKIAVNNIGATADGGIGEYYAWGETSPKSSYTLSNYAFYDSSNDVITKYTAQDATLELSDDAAYVNMGNGWRMMNSNEYSVLSNNSYAPREMRAKYKSGDTWIHGLVLYDGRSSSRYVFFPYGGYKDGTTLHYYNDTFAYLYGSGGLTREYCTWYNKVYYSYGLTNNWRSAWSFGLSLSYGGVTNTFEPRYHGINIRGFAD